MPDLLPGIAEMLPMLKVPDSIVDSSDLAGEFGVRLTSVHEWARSLVPISVG